MLTWIENPLFKPEPTDESMEPHATQLDQNAPRGGPVKFTYANGARPLAGYTIKRGVGRGGFGEVYFAVSDGGKEVALKLIRHNLDIELRGVTHCLNLKHPNLIALYDVKQDEQDNSWVVMEYATGESLEDVIRRHPQGMPADQVADWMHGIAAGVAYLHDHGIVHRDLKPGNIFRDDGQVKLGDYGLSKFISCSRRSGQTESIGTVHYMAPEISNGRYGKEIDIYALGIILYEMLTGRVPFEGESVGEVLMKHLTAEPSLAEVAADYRDVISRALAKDPTRRFESIGQLVSALPAVAGAAYRAPLVETLAADAPLAANVERLPPPQAVYTPQAANAPQGQLAQQAPPPSGGLFPDDEPIWRAVRDGWRSTRDSWDNLGTPSKIGVVVLGVMLISNSYTWDFAINVVPPLISLYICYRVARFVLMQQAGHSAATVSAPPRPEPIPRPTAAGPSEPAATMYQATSSDARRPEWRHVGKRGRRGSGRHWREQAAAALVVKSPRERLADLAGSMIFAAVICAVMCVVAILLRGGESIVKEQYAWLALVSLLGSWAILIPSKLWEGTLGDQTLRRVALLIVGLAMGAVAYLAADMLMITFPDTPSLHAVSSNLGGRFYDAKGAPLLYAYLAYFGGLFATVRWWKQADPLRHTRLSLWNTGWSVFAAWVIDWIWAFPQPWGLMVAAIISISVQLVSPFVPQHDRVARTAGME